MSLRSLRILVLLCLLAMAAAFTLAAQTSKQDSSQAVKEKPRRRIESPPKDYPVTRFANGIDYVAGWILLESEKDTALLKKFGFRIYNLAKIDSMGAQYEAEWPNELPWDSLPPQLKGVVYDEVFPKEQLNVSADSVKASQPSTNPLK
jgi:hypothetical protein